MKCLTPLSRLSLILLLATAYVAAPVASGQDWAKAALEKSPRHGEWVTVKHGDRAVETFVVYPESKSKTPIVLLIHEIFGMTDWDQTAGAALPFQGMPSAKPSASLAPTKSPRT